MIRKLALFALVLCLAPAIGNAVVTSTWTVSSYKELDKGEADAAFITSLGEVKPGWATDKTDLEFSTVWSSVRGADGTVYMGSDEDGAIFAAKNKKVSKLATIDSAVAVVSLAMSSDGTLYAGTMPGGEIWKIDSRSGKSSKLAKLDKVETVWSLVLSKDGKALYAGTGPKGKLFRVDRASGSAKVAFESDDKRILALATTADGGVWFGTSDKALVFRHDPKTKTTRAMADFTGNEVTALAEFSGGVVAAANELKEPTTSGTKTKAAVDAAKKKKDPGEEGKDPKEGDKPGADKETPSGATVARKGARKGKGTLWRIRGDGQTQQLHSLKSTYFTALAVAKDGRIFAGAADKGRIYLVDTDESVSTAMDVSQRMIAQIMHSEAQGLAFTTSDAGALYKATGRASKATYTSDVFDAKAPSRFGKVVWLGTGKLALETRSGNTAKPGKGWSQWQTPRSASRGGGKSMRGKIASPPGRYIQYRVKFNGGRDDSLRQTIVYYLPQNKPTRVEEVEVEVGQSRSKLQTLKSGASKPKSPVVEVSWKVDNDDKDDTVYSLAVRREGDARWRKIETGDEPLTKTKFEWNTETFPDGYYRLRVTANDRRANSADRAIESHKTTPLFLVDNEKPDVAGITVKYPKATARATDAMSAIAEMAYTVDDGEWIVGATQDGLFDDLTEMLQLALPPDLSPGVHTLAIRVADEAGNIGSASVTFRVR